MSNSQKVAGYIGHYGLSEWWFGTFSEEERNYINFRYRTSVGSHDCKCNILTEGIPWTNHDPNYYGATSLLNNLTHWFRRPKDHSIARRIALKAYELAEDIDNISSALSWIIRLYYSARDTIPEALDIVIACCQHHIALAPLLADGHRKKFPSLSLGKHEGYNRYVILLEKQGDYSEVISFCKEAKQQGWSGDWDKRIERCTQKLSKGVKKKS